MSLPYELRIMVKHVCYMGLWIYCFLDLGVIIPKGSVIIGRTSLINMGHSGSDSIMPLMLRMVCCAITEKLVLYYRSFGTAPTLLRNGNISSKPCMRVMTYKALDVFALNQLGNYCRFYTISFENPKTCQMVY
jgi:hypothetical protein